MLKRLSFRPFTTIRLLLLQLCLLPAFLTGAQSGGATGFENNSTASWTAGGSTESVSINSTAANNRTGGYSLVFSTTATGSNKYWYTNGIYGSSASGTYVHFIYWALGSDNVTSMDPSMRYTGTAPPSGTGSTANATGIAINTSSWTRLSYAAGNANGRHYFPAPRRTSGNATSVYIDDLVMYTSSSNTTDLTPPGAPGAASGTVSSSNVSLAWTSNTDAGTGVQATMILRTANLGAAAPAPNNQALYSTTGGAAGPDTIGSWDVISTSTGATATSFTDAGVPTGSYKYAIVLRDLAYNYSAAAVTSTIVVGTPSPSITVTPGSFTGLFGNTVTGTISASQSYSVSGTALAANVAIAAPAGFEISTTAGSGYASSLSLAPVSGTLSATTIYVRYAPSSATGASGALSVTHSSTGATSQNIGVSGNALALEPTTNGAVSASPVNATNASLNVTAGNGSRRIIVVRQGSAVSFTPSDGTALAGVNADFSLATDQGSGNKILYDGTGSGSALISATSLTAGATYYVTVYEYNAGSGTSQNYLTSAPASTSFTTPVPTPSISLTTTGFSGAFGNVVAGGSSPSQSYTVSGTNLTAALVIGAPAGFEISLASGSGFGTTLSLPATGGIVAATTIYTRFSPTGATGATGISVINHSSTGAAPQTATVSGNALATEPSSAGTISFGTPGTSTVTVNLPTIGNGSMRIIVVKQGIATTWTPSDGVAITGVNSDFSLATDQGGANKVVYDGNGSGSGVATITGLTAGTAYYFTVFEYNTGTGSSQNFLLTPAATGNISTAGLPSPAITINTTGFGNAFGNTVSGTTSTAQTYVVSGSNLSANLDIAAPAGFEISLAAGSGFGTALSLAPISGSVAATTVYARFAPVAASGATGPLTIAHSSTGATTQTIGVSGNALATEPVSAGTIGIGTTSGNSMGLNLPTIGSGTKRIIVARQGSAVSFQPADGIVYSGTNADFSTATDQGSGNKIIYDGSGSGTGIVTVTGLNPATTYHFAVFEYNEGTGTSQNYLQSPSASVSGATGTPAIVLNQVGFTQGFGNTVAGNVSIAQSYQLSGTNLTGNVGIAAPAGFEVSLSASTGFASSLSVSPGAGTLNSTTIYARFAPIAASGATGTLIVTHTSPGAATQNLSVSGNALATEPTTAGSIGFGARTGSSIVINLPTVGNGSKRIIVAKQAASLSFVPVDGIAPAGVNANFTLALNQGSGDRIVYAGSGTGSAVVTVTGLSAATGYVFSVFEYNEGTGTSQNYLLNPAVSDTASTLAPAIVITPGTFTGTFGAIVAGANSPSQSFSVSGSNLIANIAIAAPTGFQISLASGSGYGSSLSLTPAAGTVSATTIYVRFAPAAATGATGSQNIAATSTSAIPQSIAVSGTAIATEPTSSGSIGIGNVTTSSATISLPTVGNGNRRLIFCRPLANSALIPADGNAYGGVDANYPLATDHGSGNHVVYDGTGSGAGLVTVSGLTSGIAYRFTVYEYNAGSGTSQNYRTSVAATDTVTIRIPIQQINVSTIGFNNSFGNVITGSRSAISSYQVSGTNLSDSVIIAGPAGFELSLSATTGFVTRLPLPQSNGTLANTTIYVRFAPLLPTGSTAPLTIIHSSPGAVSRSVQVNGVALAVRPSAIGSIAFGDVDSSSISIHLPTTGNGSRRLIVANLGSPAAFIPVDATGYTGISNDFSLAAAQSMGGKIIYDGSGSGNDVVKVSGLSNNMLYYFTVYEYNLGSGNSHCYLTNPAVSSNMTTYDPTVPSTGISHPAAPQVRVYPNPAGGLVHVDAPQPVIVTIYDATGKILLRTMHTEISVEQFPAGIAFVRIADAQGRFISQHKIRIQH